MESMGSLWGAYAESMMTHALHITQLSEWVRNDRGRGRSHHLPSSTESQGDGSMPVKWEGAWR